MVGDGEFQRGPPVALMKRAAGGDVLVAVPGRLIDLIEAGIVRLNRVTYFVLDEADHMLEKGFQYQLVAITSQVEAPVRIVCMCCVSAGWAGDWRCKTIAGTSGKVVSQKKTL